MVVVGAGFAGLAAADFLRRANVSYVVLEATDRVGGRARTDYQLGAGRPVELGAQMVHGRRARTHAWIHRAGLTTRPYPILQRARFVVDRRVGATPWTALPFHPVVGARATVRGLLTIPRSFRRHQGPDASVADRLDALGADRATRLLVELLCAHVFAADPDEVGIAGQGAEEAMAEESFGFRNFQVEAGYTALAERIAGVTKDRIRLQRPVRDIGWDSRGVTVRADGPGGAAEEWRARSAIVTVPLGVLRDGQPRFDPPLPAPKRRAIERVGFADGYAVTLRVDDARLATLGDFALLWGGTASTFYRPRVGRREPGTLLTAFTVGREARRRGALDDERLVEATVDEWTGIAPAHASLGRVSGAVVHRWSADPWARGAYSFLPVGVGIDDRAALAEPVEGRLFFAGEATDVGGAAATVSGALRTGERAAEEALRAERRLGRPVAG